jgi:hypothetical protein
MRLLVLAAAATLIVTGSAMADDSVQSPVKESHHHHHYRDANASVSSDAAPADVLNAHELRLRNLRDSGYNPTNDFTSAGDMKAN